MLIYQPPGFEQRAIATELGIMAYYTQSNPVLGTLPNTAPVYIFLHSLGGGSSAFEWSKCYPAWAGRSHIIAMDLVGWGQSAHPPRIYSAEDYLTLIEQGIRAVLRERAVSGNSPPPLILFASSLTAGLMVRLAIRQPKLFQTLVLVCPSGYGDFGMGYEFGLSAQLARLPGVDQALYQLGAANATAVQSVLQQFLFAQPARVTAEMVAAYLASAQQPNSQYSALASLRGDLCFDLALYWPRLQVPTILLWGEEARFSTLSTGRRLAALNPNTLMAFYSIPNAGVLPHLEAPEWAIAALEPHLAPI